MSRGTRSALLDWTIPIVLLAILTLPFFRTNIDMHIARHFYVPGVGFPTGAKPVWHWFKHYGAIPPLAVAIAALGVVIGSFMGPRMRALRRGAIYMVLVMAIGPGLITNDVFKDHWGRPRPRDIVGMGGTRDYVPPLVMNPADYGHSFASGHAAVAFYLLTPYFLLRRRSPWKAAVVFVVGLTYGSLMGYARMAQGAHFLSDVLWSLGIVYVCALTVFYVLGLHRRTSPV